MLALITFLTTALSATASAAEAKLPALTAAIERGDYIKITSVLVEQHGRIVYEHYHAGDGQRSLHDVRSAGKSVTALAVGTAIADGVLPSVDTPAFARLSDLAPFANDGPAKQAILLRDLLTMSSAISCNDWEDASPGNEERMYPTRSWARFAADLPTVPEYARDASGYGRFSYCTAGAFLTGQIVQRATGERVDRYVQHRLFNPLGIHAVAWVSSPSGEIQTGGQTSYRTRDLAKIGRLVLNHGRWRGKQVVPSAWVNAMLTPRRRADADNDYGYFWWRRDFTTSTGAHSGWYMSGNGGNKVIVLRDLDAVVVVTSTNFNAHGMHQQTTDLVDRHVLPMLELATSK